MAKTPPRQGLSEWAILDSNQVDNVPYMGVVVASTSSKSGSTISGDIVRIVVAQTDAGHAPNPGHEGTGKIVATYC